MARWGLQVNRHGTSFIKINFNPRVCFYNYFFTQLYRPSYVKQFLDGVKKIQTIQQKQDTTIFHLYSKLLTLWLVCEKM